MHQRKTSKTVLAHGHDEPVLTCPRCRTLLIKRAHNQVVIPALKRLAHNKGIDLENLIMALSQAQFHPRKAG
jgi:hypothetical protein